MLVYSYRGIVEISTDAGKIKVLADKGNEPASLRAQAEEHRQRAARLLERAALMEQAADRLE